MLGLVIGLLVAALSAVAVMRAMRTERGASSPLGGTIVYTAPTANQSAIRLDGAVRSMIEQAGLAHQSVRLVRVEGNGTVGSSTVDLTPRIDGKPLKVQERAVEEIAHTITDLEDQLNSKSSTVAGQALFAGLSRTRIDVSRPIFIFSSGLDTTDPVDFRKLAFDVAPANLVQDLKNSGELPVLHGAVVTFVVRAESGAQAALRRPQVTYREALWSAVLRAAGAQTVRFDYPDAMPSSSMLAAPAVPIPLPPSTPVPARPTRVPGEKTCTLSAGTYFASDQAVLLDRAATLRALAACVKSIGPATRVSVEGHTSTTAMRPNNPVALRLSVQRAQVVAGLLVQLGVARNRVDAKGFGNGQQPFPSPSDPRNRCVVVRFTNPS